MNRRLRTMQFRWAWLGLLGLLLPTAPAAQVVVPEPLTELDSAYFAGDPAFTLRLLEPAGQGAMLSQDARWRLFRAHVALAVMAPSAEARNRILDPALPLATHTASERQPSVDLLYWTAALEGLRSLETGPRQTIKLATSARRHAQQVLAADPQHGGAHHLLARIEYEFLTLPRAERILARILMGSSYPSEATWESCAAHFRTAAQLWPQFVQVHHDRARMELRRGRLADAAQAAERALATPSLHPQDGRLKEDARALLRYLGQT
jgi:hypothetical protein